MEARVLVIHARQSGKKRSQAPTPAFLCSRMEPPEGVPPLPRMASTGSDVPLDRAVSVASSVASIDVPLDHTVSVASSGSSRSSSRSRANPRDLLDGSPREYDPASADGRQPAAGRAYSLPPLEWRAIVHLGVALLAFASCDTVARASVGDGGFALGARAAIGGLALGWLFSRPASTVRSSAAASRSIAANTGRLRRAKANLALAKAALHERLGAASPASVLPADVVEKVAHSLNVHLTAKWKSARSSSRHEHERATVECQMVAIQQALARGECEQVHMEPASATQRFFAHQLAEEMGFVSVSEGVGADRHCVIRRPSRWHRLQVRVRACPRGTCAVCSSASPRRHPLFFAVITAVLTLAFSLAWVVEFDSPDVTAEVRKFMRSPAAAPVIAGFPFVWKILLFPMGARAWQRIDETHRWRSRPYEDDLIVIIAKLPQNIAPRELTAASVSYSSFGGLSLTKLYRRQTNAIKLLNREAWRSARAQRMSATEESHVLLVPSASDTFRLLMPISNALSKPFRAGAVMRCGWLFVS